MSDHFIKEIVSGGQTGVDRAALDIAIEFEISHGGWCPFGRKAEDGIISSKYNLKEAPAPTLKENLDSDAIYKMRTEFNARDSDGTLIIVKAEPMGGTLYTLQMAGKHKKPYLICNLSENPTLNDVINWIMKHKIHKLNVAGPRASQTMGIYKDAYYFLSQLLSHNLLILTEEKILR